jgi:hypothetical protein
MGVEQANNLLRIDELGMRAAICFNDRMGCALDK